jgi:predicted molibdopterin-dependent oxidoreductase YjgC
LDFFVLQDIFPTETSAFADVLLPGVSFAEKNGTFTNTERRVQLVRQAIPPLGEARQDWQITTEIATRLLETLQSSRSIDVDAPWARWKYTSAADIMTEVNALAPSYAGVTHARLEQGDRLHWPVATTEHPGTPILHTKGFSRGKGKFMPIDFVPPPELPDDEYPMILSTGRVLYHWHGGEMTRRTKGLMEVYGNALVEVNPDDAVKLGLNGKRIVRVSSRRGSIEAESWITDRVPPGMVYANFHFPESSANELTIAALDPVSKIPSYKVCAVKVEAIK